MPRLGLGVGGGGSGGAGLTLGPETNEFTSTTARDTYATANADWLAEYDANTAFLVAVTVSGTTTYYRRSGSAWETVTNIIKGGKGDKGDNPTSAEIQTAIPLIGQLVATLTYSIGSYSQNQLISWVLDANAPAGITVEDLTIGGNAYTDARLNIGRIKRLVDRHVGWIFQVKLDGVVFQESTYGLGNLPIGNERWGVGIPSAEFPISTTNPLVNPNIYGALTTDNELWLLNYIRGGGFVIAAGDPIITIEFRLLLS